MASRRALIGLVVALLAATGGMEWWRARQEARVGAELAAQAQPGDIQLLSSTSCSPRLPARWLRHHWLAPLASATTTARPASARQGTWPGAVLTARP